MDDGANGLRTVVRVQIDERILERARKPARIADDPLPDFLWRRVLPEPNSGCWLWTGALNRLGYGVVHSRKRGGKFAHRLAYQVWRGEIPAKFDIDHLCRVRCCINPDHLEAVTHQENVRRGNLSQVSAARAAKRTHCPQGHPYDAANTGRTKEGARTCRACTRARHRDWKARKAAL